MMQKNNNAFILILYNSMRYNVNFPSYSRSERLNLKGAYWNLQQNLLGILAVHIR